MKIKIKYFNENCKPTKGSLGAAASDLYANLTEDVTILPGQTVKIPVGFALAVPEDYLMWAIPRSRIANSGLIIPNSPGTIDSDYRGEVLVALRNLGNGISIIQPLERIAQYVIIQPIAHELESVNELDETARGAGGFGSTGK